MYRLHTSPVHCTLRQLLVKPKDPVPPDRRKGAVYKISCKDCSYSYIGQTGRSLSDRIKEHKWAVSRVNVDDSALAEHVVNSSHEMDWCSAMILDTSRFFSIRDAIWSHGIYRREDTS